MNERTTPGFAEFTVLRFSAPLLLVSALVLLNIEPSWGLGFALGAVAGTAGAYFSWLHLQKLMNNPAPRNGVSNQDTSRLRRKRRGMNPERFNRSALQAQPQTQPNEGADDETTTRSPQAKQIQRGAASGALAGIALMAVVLAASALTPWLNIFATAAGLIVPKWLIALTPFLRRTDGRNR